MNNGSAGQYIRRASINLLSRVNPQKESGGRTFFLLQPLCSPYIEENNDSEPAYLVHGVFLSRKMLQLMSAF